MDPKYPTLNAELARRGITMEAVAKAIGRTVGTVSLKLAGRFPFTFKEAVAIKKLIGTDMSLEELFKEVE